MADVDTQAQGMPHADHTEKGNAHMRFAAVLGSVAVAAVALSFQAHAQPYPSQQIRLIVPFAAGGVTDLLARMAGDHIKAKTGQSVVVENRPGAGGNTGPTRS